MPELRKCKIRGADKPERVGLFHMWTYDENGDAWAIVELSDGSIDRFGYCDVFFVNDLWVTDGIAKSTSNNYVQMMFNVPVECINIDAYVNKYDCDVAHGESAYDVKIKNVTVEHCEYELLLDNCDDLKIDQLAIKQHLES